MTLPWAQASRIPNILAYAVGCLSIVFALAQVRASCQTCSRIFQTVGILFLLVILLCVITPRKVRRRLRPIAVGFLGFVLCTLLLH